MSRPLYSPSDFGRETGEEVAAESPWRTPIGRDYGRIIHSASFRRLQGKTQVFPGHESDFFRNRLTHSLEVAQIAEGIAERLNHECPELLAAPEDQKINTRLCAVASLLHDLGHPPFGHNGERALDDAMRKHGGFEGNAQSLRIVTRLEKKVRAGGQPLGLALTFRSLAAILKYDKPILRSRRPEQKVAKGYYQTEQALVQKIKLAVAGSPVDELKTVECAIMDLADDIAYSTYDLEDSLKAGFLTPAGILASSDALLFQVAKKVSGELGLDISPADVSQVFVNIFDFDNSLDREAEDEGPLVNFISRYRAYEQVASSAYFRTQLSSQLVKEAINSVQIDYHSPNPVLSKVYLSPEAHLQVEVLKQYTFLATIYSSRVKLPEFRGYEVVKGLFKALAGKPGNLLMPDDVREQFESVGADHDTQMRIVCDFVAGMTDRYAMEFYGRLHSDTAQSMFKPV